MFPRCFAIPKQREIKIFLNLGLMRWAKGGLSGLRSSVVPGACIRLFSGLVGASLGLPLSYSTNIAK